MLRNNIALVIDNSGSMSSISNKARDIINSWLDKIKTEAETNKQRTDVSIITFGESAKIFENYKNIPSYSIQPVKYQPNEPRTALFKGIQLAIDTLDEVKPSPLFDDAYLLIIITDGQENASDRDYITKVINNIKTKQATDKWTFTFMLPYADMSYFVKEYNIPSGNVIEWDKSSENLYHIKEQTNIGLASYYQSRSCGKTSVSNFYAKTDLSKISQKDLNKKLTNLNKICTIFPVKKESIIKDFVENATYNKYTKGSTYYQLMKSEKVQANKDILIVDKSTNDIWGGIEARSMIGIPLNMPIKVDPGNHANYDVYIQSNSVNRILPRGTKIIVKK